MPLTVLLPKLTKQSNRNNSILLTGSINMNYKLRKQPIELQGMPAQKVQQAFNEALSEE